MVPNIFSERRNVLRVFTALSVISISRTAFGQAFDNGTVEAADGVSEAPIDDKKGGKDAGKKPKGVTLTVAVSGNGLPIAQAEVKIKFQRGADDELIRPTNHAGEAVFESASRGPAKVRVIAKGWQTKGQDVSLTEEPQRVMIALTPQS